MWFLYKASERCWEETILQDIRKLARKQTEEDFDNFLKQFLETWKHASPTYIQYFNSKLFYIVYLF